MSILEVGNLFIENKEYNGDGKSPSQTPSCWVKHLRNSKCDYVSYDVLNRFFNSGLIGYDVDGSFYIYGESSRLCQFIMKFSNGYFNTVSLKNFIDVKLDSCGMFEKDSFGKLIIKSNSSSLERLIGGLDDVFENHYDVLDRCLGFNSHLLQCDCKDLSSLDYTRMVIDDEYVVYHGYTCKSLVSNGINVIITPSISSSGVNSDSIIVNRSLYEDNPFDFFVSRQLG